MESNILLGLAIIGLVAVNIAAYKYLGFFGLFVSVASVEFASKLLDKLWYLKRVREDNTLRRYDVCKVK